MPVAPLPHVRSELTAVSRRLHENGWVANHDGNVSLRINGDRLLITPTSTSKRDVDDASLVLVDLKGAVLEGRKKPPSEVQLHLAVLRGRPEVEAVIHAHPVHATAFGLVGSELAPISLPEMMVSMGAKVPTLARAMPNDPAQLKALEEAAKLYDGCLIAGNGVVTWGTSLEQALLRMELVEHYAKILTVAKQLGPVQALPEGDVVKLLEARKKAGLGPKT